MSWDRMVLAAYAVPDPRATTSASVEQTLA
jgi:hypothetical protein